MRRIRNWAGRGIVGRRGRRIERRSNRSIADVIFLTSIVAAHVTRAIIIILFAHTSVGHALILTCDSDATVHSAEVVIIIGTDTRNGIALAILAFKDTASSSISFTGDRLEATALVRNTDWLHARIRGGRADHSFLGATSVTANMHSARVAVLLTSHTIIDNTITVVILPVTNFLGRRIRLAGRDLLAIAANEHTLTEAFALTAEVSVVNELLIVDRLALTITAD